MRFFAKRVLPLVLIISFLCGSTMHQAGAFSVSDIIADRFKSCGVPITIPPISPWERDACTAQFVSMTVAATTIAAATGALTFGAAAAPAFITAVLSYVGVLFGVAQGISSSASLCDYKGHPYPYTNQQISQLLKANGIKPTIGNIAARYTKMCFEYMGSREWIAPNECVWMNGAMFCAFYPFATNALACVRLSSTCPCSFSIANGHLIDVDYEKDSKGIIKLDDNGSPVISNEAAWRQGFMKHCRVLNNALIPPFPDDVNTGIIDESCRSMVGYSKNPNPITAGVVQCLENTARNIFEKPILKSNSQTDVALNSQQIAVVKKYNKDIAVITDAVNKAVDILNGSSASNIAASPGINDLVNLVHGIASKSSLDPDLSRSYTVGVSNLNISGAYPNNTNIIALTTTVTQLKDLIDLVNSLSNDFVNSSKQNNSREQAITLFDSLQGAFKVLALLAIVLWVTMTGLQIILQELSIELKTLIPYLLKFGLVYYFAIGTAWKDYFFGMLFSISNGFGEMMLDMSDGDDQLSKACSYSKNYYIPDEIKDNVCTYPNARLKSGNKSPFLVGFDHRNKNKTAIYGCLKGPFISRPNYEAPFKPVYYTSATSTGDIEEVLMQVYCIAEDNSSVPAQLVKDPITQEVLKLVCPDNTVMEDGYRLSEYIKMGIADIENLDVDTNYQLISTARQILDKNQNVISVVPAYDNSVDAAANNSIRAIDARNRLVQTQYLESVRSYVNRTERQYPIVNRFGKHRDMRYISMFDTVDCKLKTYFNMQLPQSLTPLPKAFADAGAQEINRTSTISDALFGIIFATGFFGLFLFMIQLLIFFYIFAVVVKVVQSYLMSIIAIVVLVYLSPIVIPLCLFEKTNNFYTTWQKLLQSYVMYPPMLFLLLSFVMKIMDYVIYGSPASFIENSMFTDTGEVDGLNCWSKDLDNAPMICLLQKLIRSISYTHVLGMSLPYVSAGDVVRILAIQSVKTFILLYILFYFTAKAEEVFAKIFDTDSADTAISSFDNVQGTATAPFGIASSAVGAAASGARGYADRFGKSYSAWQNSKSEQGAGGGNTTARGDGPGNKPNNK